MQTPFFRDSGRPKSPIEESLSPESATSPSDEPIGGFAYVIEASDLLSLVTKFLLRYSVDVEDAQGLQFWLMKFKELDLKLLQYE